MLTGSCFVMADVIFEQNMSRIMSNVLGKEAINFCLLIALATPASFSSSTAFCSSSRIGKNVQQLGLQLLLQMCLQT